MRPFFRKSAAELRSLFDAHRDDPAMLAGLVNELANRSVSAAVRLRREVEEQLDHLKRGTNSSKEQDVNRPTRRASATSTPGGDQRDGARRKKEPARPAPRSVTTLPIASTPPPRRAVSGSRSNSAPSYQSIGRPTNLKKIQPRGVAGKPQKYIRQLKTDLVLPVSEGLSHANRYALVVGALIEDMRREKQSSRHVLLENGRRVDLDRGHVGYSFAFPEEADVFVDARVDLHVGPRTIDGQVVSVSEGQIVLAVEEDLGDRLQRCTLVIDNTALLEALKERLEQANGEGPSINVRLADGAVSGLPDRPVLDLGLGELPISGNDRQREAVRAALANEIWYLWGPPGTGKTKTLSILIEQLFEQKKRILICSNTNQAVDQVLLSLCKTLTKEHPAMKEGRIVRLGRIVHDELKSKFAEFVAIDGIVERRSRGLEARKKALEGELAEISSRMAAAETSLGWFRQLDGTVAAVKGMDTDLEHLKVAQRAAAQRQVEALRYLEELEHELERRRAAGPLHRLILRSEEAITADIRLRSEEKASVGEENAQLHERRVTLEKRRDALQAVCEGFQRRLGVTERAKLEQRMEALTRERQPLLDELASVNRGLADIRASVMRDATVIGATVAKAYLSAKTISSFDAVVIDEASMVLLPALYFVAGLARERVVVSGDFRQLPPIVQSKQRAIIDEIGHDVFHAAGIVSAVESNSPTQRTTMLNVQYRMRAAICELVSGFMYGGELSTSNEVATRLRRECAALPTELTIVDSSSLWPFEAQTVSFSRYNLIHALIVRNLAQELAKEGFFRDGRTLGICTPYSAQAKLLRRLVEDEEDLKDAVYPGTVHRYQGNEKTAIILDIPESVGGGRFVGHFLQSDEPNDDGAKLLNVALSRAQDHLVVVANLTYLDDHLPGGAMLRDVLFQMQSAGRIVDAREILSLRPADLRGLGEAVDIDIETEKTGLFGQGNFDVVFQQDVAGAKESVLIFSGFVTPERVGRYGDLFRRKVIEGVRIRCVTRPPQRNGSIPPERGREALNALEGIGAVVDCRRDIHQKIVVIDGRIVWLGSLNPLSHTGGTDEVMMRTLAPSFASELVRQTSIRSGRGRGQDGVSQGENPRCGSCGGRTFYFWSVRRRRPFFACEGDCGWIRDVDRVGSQGHPDVAPGEGQPCPKCGRATRMRRGRRGVFFGCTGYPGCNGTAGAPSDA